MKFSLRLFLVALAAFNLASARPLQAEELLFIGNSLTFGDGDKVVLKNGGVPKFIEGIAEAKGKTAQTKMVVAGGKGWDYHLQQPRTTETLAAKSWDWVSLQDYSNRATHMGNVEQFLKDGETFFHLIREKSPRSKIVLYETWARAAGADVYKGASTPKSFVDPAEMTAEIVKNYHECQRRLNALETGGRQVLLAPVGEAFAKCQAKHPEVVLISPDTKHASAQGSYLSALVLYATIYNDSPLGASNTFSWLTIDKGEAEKLQQVAEEVTVPLRK